MRGNILLVTIALLALASPLGAQTVEPTRADEVQRKREAKAARVEPYQPGKVERFLRRLEDGGFGGLFAPSDGFGLRIGGLDGGSAFALGPSWRKSLVGGNLQLSASGVRSIGGDTGADIGIAIPQLGTHRLSLGVELSAARLTRARYFGLGLETSRDDETAYGLARERAAVSVTFDVTGHLRLTAGAGTLSTETREGRSPRVPSIEQRFTATDAPGLQQRLTYTTVSAGVAFDYRDVPGNPRSGGRYAIDVTRYTAPSAQLHSFTRVDTELEQHVPFWRRQRLITLRAIASATVADRGHEVPFYLQPTLGGSRVLRGFVSDRFRDRNVVAVQAEYAWDLLPFLSAVAFAEAGTAAARWSDLGTRQLEKDYGLGFRFGSARTVAFRTDVALGSGEGTRLTMRFNHAF
jgi:outer membrane protein assembly factor BamA